MKRTQIALLLFALAAASCGTTYGIYHRVAPGETLPNIARAYGVEEEVLKIINGLGDDPLHPGQEVFVPNATRQRYITGSTGAPPPKGKGRDREKPGEGRHERTEVPAETAKAEPPKEIPPGKSFRWPVNGVLFSKYGPRDGLAHDGIDISAPEGTEVRAAADGRVIYAGDGVSGYGNLIIVKHEGFYSTVYAHNHENLAAKGDFVEAGQVIARVGQTGRATGPHLHFEVRFNAKPVNPLKLLPAKPVP